VNSVSDDVIVKTATASQANVNDVINNGNGNVDNDVFAADATNNTNDATVTNTDNGVDHVTSVDKSPASSSSHLVEVKKSRFSKCEIM
jgi:hypothetical protein